MTDHTTRLKNAAPLIASHLGVDWGVLTVTADAEDPGVVLIGNPKGQAVALHISTYDTREGRLIAEGRLPDAPNDVNRDEVSTSSITTGCIGMAPGKLGKPQQVAGEIQQPSCSPPCARRTRCGSPGLPRPAARRSAVRQQQP